MVSLSFIAGALLGSAVTLGVFALRHVSVWLRPRQSYVIALGLLAGFAIAAGLLYFAVDLRHAPDSGHALHSAAGGATAGSMAAEVAALEARLAGGGGTAGDWNLLAQAYDFLGRPADARRARAHTDGASPEPASEMSVAALAAAAAATDAGAMAAGAQAATQVTAPGAAPPTPSAAELEQRVSANPRDARSWLMLADLRRAQRDFAGARLAYAKLVELKTVSAQSWADYADVLGSLAGGSLSGEAAHAIDNALALDAQNPKALWLKASEEYQQRRFASALGWWKKLRAELPPDSPDARIIDDNIAESAALAGVKAETAGANGPVTAAAAASGGAAEVSGTVSLDSRFADRVPPDSTLFIYAKAADSPGPPLAVLRTTAHSWPVAFTLDDSMAMMPSRRLSQFPKVVVEARISRSGQATPAAGDLYVTSPALAPSHGTRVALVINREIG
jgi:cytochrome c-type biogenesis protein CcmH/NrfG